ncbi:MAG: ferredoxin family protein [Armatimonadota bacterium]
MSINATATKPTKKRRKTYDIRINEPWCKACGICSAFCPTGALEDSGRGRPVIADPEACNGCQLCVIRCPDFAIVVEERGGEDAG